MIKRKMMYVFLATVGMAYFSSANAANFSVSGKVKKVMADQYYGGCMIYLDKNIGLSCPNGWVSLDCKGLIYDKSLELGKKKFASALAAAQSGKTVIVYGNDLNKINGNCVAQRVDVRY